MIDFFNRNPFRRMTIYRDRADRAAIAFLEGHAVRGTITRQMVMRVSDVINREPRHLIRMVPDLRRRRRYEKALAGLRTAGLLDEHFDGPMIEQ